MNTRSGGVNDATFTTPLEGEEGESPETPWGGDNGAYVVAAWLEQIQTGRGLSGIGVPVVDEASMGDDRAAAMPVTEVARTGTKVVAIVQRVVGAGCPRAGVRSAEPLREALDTDNSLPVVVRTRAVAAFSGEGERGCRRHAKGDQYAQAGEVGGRVRPTGLRDPAATSAEMDSERDQPITASTRPRPVRPVRPRPSAAAPHRSSGPAR